MDYSLFVVKTVWVLVKVCEIWQICKYAIQLTPEIVKVWAKSCYFGNNLHNNIIKVVEWKGQNDIILLFVVLGRWHNNDSMSW